MTTALDTPVTATLSLEQLSVLELASRIAAQATVVYLTSRLPIGVISCERVTPEAYPAMQRVCVLMMNPFTWTAALSTALEHWNVGQPPSTWQIVDLDSDAQPALIPADVELAGGKGIMRRWALSA
jgi:hypothetical protein